MLDLLDYEQQQEDKRDQTLMGMFINQISIDILNKYIDTKDLESRKKLEK